MRLFEVALTASLLLFSLTYTSAASIQDFFDIDNQFKFMFHKNHNLLLTVRGDSCYFLALTEDADFNQLSAEHRTETENALKELINKHDDDQIKVSSLEEMRSTFSDLLADFQCMGKDVYAIAPTQEEDSNGHNHIHIPGFFNPIKWMQGGWNAMTHIFG